MLFLAPILVLALLVPILGVAWYYATLLQREAIEPERKPPRLDLDVVSVDGPRVILRARRKPAARELAERAIFGLQWNEGYARLAPPLESSVDGATRELEPGAQQPPVGAKARLDAYSYPGNPREAHGLDFREVQIHTPEGVCPAWRVDGERNDAWVIAVHGKGATRREALRALPAFHAASLTSLLITYRNDAGARADPVGYRYGATEWKDLEAAVQYAVDEGARQIVLAGYSMGGAIALSFMERSPLHAKVVAIVLDAPVLDFQATVAFASRGAGTPRPVIWLGCFVAGRRFGINWRELNYLEAGRRLTVPVLLFHGAADRRVPVATSDSFARSRPDIVTYVRIADAGHVRSWNTGPEEYEATVRGFLAEHTPEA